jgi:Family of unknown function (DUF6399)
MTPTHPTDPVASRTDPFRWDRPTRAQAHDHFQHPDHSSQRAYAREHGLPRSTLGAWLRDDRPDDPDPDLEPEVRAFFRSAAGQRFLRRLVLALFVVFLFGAACGLRRLALFLRRTALDRFVAPSSGALHELGQAIQADLGRFADEERPRLAEGMKHRHIALVPDENFHGEHLCLVAAEPASNFLFVEQYAERRDEATWTLAIEQGLAGLPVTVLLVSSDQAKGIIACAQNGLEAQHLPELFHGQRDLCRPLMGPLERQREAAQKRLEQAEGQLRACRAEAEQARLQPARPGRPKDHARVIAQSAAQVAGCTQQAQQCQARQEQARAAVRGLADDYHPFDSQTGAAVQEAEVEQRLGQRLQALAQVAEQAELGGKAQEALARGQRWVRLLVAALAWFWGVARVCVEGLDLPEPAERGVYEQLLPGLYWQQAARRARTAEERRHQEGLAERLLSEAWAAGGVLSRLREEEQEEVQRVSNEVVGLFARSSSCVEGRNGRLALFHHGQTRLSAGRLKALTVIHNYLSERADGTTAAERFFGKKPRDLFKWLLQRMPDLPRPAAKRGQKATPTIAKAG